ncbi:MAG: YesL family protein [Clostridia bacterium]|nr:YesL family protein [Clostridia bacterium]
MSNYYDNEEKRKKPTWFDRVQKEREGVSPDDPKALDKPTVGSFFKLFGRKINTLLSVNLLYVFGNFPIFFFLLALSGYVSDSTSAPYYQQFAPLLGASYFDPSPVTASLLGIFGAHISITVPTVFTNILYGLTALLFVTFGPVNVGTTYLLRSMVREEGMFLMSDFWYAIKKNLRQGLIFGVIDLLIMALLGYDFLYFYINLGSGSTFIYILFFITFAMIIVYAMMRMYIYLMMVTFDLSIAKMLKNALFFSILGIKRNIMALLWVVLLIALEYVILMVFAPLGVILPLILLFSVGAFGCAFAAYPKIKEIMIDPYYSETPTPRNED